MKLTHIDDVDGFFKVVDSCKGTVELITKDGDRINLASQLSKMLAAAGYFNTHINEIEEVELVVHEAEDVNKFINFMMRG